MQAGPKIYTAVPPPLMAADVYGMNQTVINTVFPQLVRAINTDNALAAPAIDVFTALGGVADWVRPPCHVVAGPAVD
jgi:hypothetical protein